MAEKNIEKPVTVDTEKKKKQAAEPAPKFLIEKLRANCALLFGVTSSTFDGAFYGCTEKEMSIEDAKARITDWLGKEAR